jgi:uncharacterized protein with FMN-binding domain
MRRVILAVAGTVASLVLLLSFKTHGTAAIGTPPGAVSTGTARSTTSSTSSSAGSSTGASSTASATRTITGQAVDTPYGPVQVQVKVRGRNIVSATAVAYPQGSARDAQINAYAIPYLNSEATRANTANIAMVSGATYTSAGYVQSLQSALDQL